MTMDSSTIKLEDLLRHPDDLDKIPAMKLEYVRKKAAVDLQLRTGLAEQLDVTTNGMNGIADGQKTVQAVKDEMMKIDKLCAEAQNMIKDFPNINLVSQTHRNFSAVEAMRDNLVTFNSKIDRIEGLLKADDENPIEMPHLLTVHYELTQLRNIKDDAMEQIERADDESLKNTLEDYFQRLDETIVWFDEHIGAVAWNHINFLIEGNLALIVRFAVIIEAEEKSDKRVKALQEALKDHKEMAARFQSITDGAKQTRGYKEKFIQAIEVHAKEQCLESKQAFLEDPERLEKELKWFFNDLQAVKVGLVQLVPKKWKMLETYVKIYHTVMHDFLIEMIDDPDTASSNLLAILNWPERYYKKMAKLGFKQESLDPPILDNRESEMVRDFRQLIIRFLDEWLDRIFKTEQKDFGGRNVDGANLIADEYGYFRTRNLVDMWKMLQEQIEGAANSKRQDIVEGVVDSMLARLRTRQENWKLMLDDEAKKYLGKEPELVGDSLAPYQDWLVATANDQIACIQGDENKLAYLDNLQQKYMEHVSPQYAERIEADVAELSNGYVDFSTHCIAKFVEMVFLVDFQSVMPEFFTPRWYPQNHMQQMVNTFAEYVNDYKSVLQPVLLDIFFEELADSLLVRYLSSVRNKGAKFKRSEPYREKIFSDVSTAFELFSNPYLSPETADNLKTKWRVAEKFLALIEGDKASIPDIFAEFKGSHWDLQLSWVEAVLRARDDFDRSLLNAVKARAAQIEVVRGADTIMARVK